MKHNSKVNEIALVYTLLNMHVIHASEFNLSWQLHVFVVVGVLLHDCIYRLQLDLTLVI